LIWTGVPPREFTLRTTLAGCDKLPLVPVIVSVWLPAGVEFAVVTVSVDVPEPLIEAGFKLAVVPGGNPLTASDTFPVKPF
jgi:hypothetical protein